MSRMKNQTQCESRTHTHTHLPDPRTTAVDPLQEVDLLQRQVEEGVVKVPQQDVLEGETLVGQEPVPQRESALVLGDAQQEDGTDGQAVPEDPLPAPGPTDNLREERNKDIKDKLCPISRGGRGRSSPGVYQNLQPET